MELKFKIEVSNNHFVVELFGRLIEWSLFLKRNPFSCSDFIMFRNSKMTDFFQLAANHPFSQGREIQDDFS